MKMVMKSALVASLLAEVSASNYPDIYAQPPTTENGCECKSTCKTSFFKKCFTAPTCKVDGKHCKNKQFEALTWDWCVYNEFSEYESKSAAEKKDLVMSHVTKDTDSAEFPSPLKVLTGIGKESVRVSFHSSADIFPEKREKWIHSVGVTGGIKFESSGTHEYTGLFKGAEHGIIRLSIAKAPDTTLAPGMAVKFFRDGRPSANFVAMYSLDGQDCGERFFFNTWSNHIENTDNFGLKLIAAKFWQASYCPLMVGLSDLSSESPGTTGKFPFELRFISSDQTECPCDDFAQCLKNLEELKVGSQLFKVIATSSPHGNFEEIGKIVLTDKLTSSIFGDKELFFKHQNMEDDFNLMPEWLESIDRKQQCGMGCAGMKAPEIKDGCNSPFNHSSAAAAVDADMLTSDVQFVV